MKKVQYYVPNTSMWKWELLSENFIRYQFERAQNAYRNAETDLRNLDDDVEKIEQEIRGVWVSANVQMMRAFEARLKDIRYERKRINYVLFRLRETIDRMRAHLPQGAS